MSDDHEAKGSGHKPRPIAESERSDGEESDAASEATGAGSTGPKAPQTTNAV